MKNGLRILVAICLCALPLISPVPTHADVEVPALKYRVTDLTGTLNPDQFAALEAKLSAFEKQKGSQVAVLIVPTTQPESIEEYSIRVVEKWKLGRKRVDDGVLLLVAKDDKKLRIEVGYGLEGAIPDAIARRIIAEDIAPRFKQGDFYGGIVLGVDRILRTIEGEPIIGATSPSNSWMRGEFWKEIVHTTPTEILLGTLFLVLGGIFEGLRKCLPADYPIERIVLKIGRAHV
jgi:uncharacterized protein